MKQNNTNIYKMRFFLGLIISISLSDVSSTVYASQELSEDLEKSNNFGVVQPIDCEGKEVIFFNKYTKQYLDSDEKMVYTSPNYTAPSSIDTSYMGTRWLVIKNAENNYSFKSLDSSRYLDNYNGRVYTSPKNTGKYTGTRWEIIPNSSTDNDYSFKSISSSQYLDNYIYSYSPEKGGLYTSPSNSNGEGYTATHWKIGIMAIPKSKIQQIIKSAYPSFPLNIISIRTDDSMYQTLETATVSSIWKNSNLSNFKFAEKKFDCEDFVVCLKAAVSRWIDDQPQNTPSGAAFGIMFGKREIVVDEKEKIKKIKKHAYNFYITPYLEFKLIKAQRGTSQKLDKYDPYLSFM